MKFARNFSLLVAVVFASISQAETLTYTSHTKVGSMFLGSCELNVRTDGENVGFKPGSMAKEFIGYMPKKAGTLYIPKQYPAIGENGTVFVTTESLTIEFDVRNGNLQPVSYVYSDLRVNTYGIKIGAKPCNLQPNITAEAGK